jgi:epoxide hydrolase 4
MIDPATMISVVVAVVVLGLGVAGMQVRRRRVLAAELRGRTARACEALGAESTFVTLEDVTLHVVVAGPKHGPLVVLLHGFPECWYTWRSQIPRLVALGYRVVVPDQRGYGLSDKPGGLGSYSFDVLVEDVRQLVHEFDRGSATIIAHDWGGAVAWKLAMDRPEIVQKLVIMDAPHPVAFARALKHDFAQVKRIWYMATFQLPLMPDAFLSFSPPWTAKFFFHDNAYQKDAFSPDDLAFMASNLAQPGAMTTMIDWYRAAVWHPAKNPDVVIEQPTLLLWAENDVALGLGLTEGLSNWVPNMQRVLVPECGHWVQNEQPQIVGEAIERFLTDPAVEAP